MNSGSHQAKRDQAAQTSTSQQGFSQNSLPNLTYCASLESPMELDDRVRRRVQLIHTHGLPGLALNRVDQAL